MRVLFVVGGTYVSGIEVVMHDLMTALASRGVDLHCLTSGWNDGDFQGRLSRSGIPFSTTKLGWVFARKPLWTLDSLLHAPGAYRDIARVLRTFRPDVVWFVSLRNAVAMAPVTQNLVRVMHFHDDPLPDRQLRLLTRLVSPALDATVSNSEYIRGTVVRSGAPAETAHAILNGVPCGFPRRTRVRDGVPIVGIVGQILPHKGHEVLFRALAVARERGATLRCRVYGRGSNEEVSRLRELAAVLSLGDLVSFEGFVPERSTIYDALDVVAVPTLRPEPFGLVAAEPGAYGLPVIASRIGGLPEVVEHGVTGLLVPPGDHVALGDALVRLGQSSELRGSLGSAAREHIERDLSIDRMAERVEELLLTLTRERARRAC